MGPSMIVDGDVVELGLEHLPDDASMGPSMIVDGDQAEQDPQRAFRELQWGRR